MRILLVEDDQRIADFLVRALNAEGHQCTHVDSGKQAVSFIQNGDFEFILLDVMLPEGVSGIDICHELRIRKNSTPIIMLTAMDSTEDVINGLKSGADDYITKPFDIDELLIRIDTVARRTSNTNHIDPVLKIADVKMNRDSKIVTVAGVDISLTAKELSILELLMANPNRLFSRERILNNVWGTNVDPLTNVVDVYIGRLRKKLGKDKLPFIETVRGMGYRIDTEISTNPQ